MNERVECNLQQWLVQRGSGSSQCPVGSRSFPFHLGRSQDRYRVYHISLMMCFCVSDRYIEVSEEFAAAVNNK